MPLKSNQASLRQHEFRRLISPFTLRRIKASVLPELPEKIEDIRFCKLLGEQVRLYREAVSTQGQTLLAALQDEGGKVPYIHIFALLNLLKQICDHPALLDKTVAQYRDYKSGKWELFKELLEESVGSGQKVVVYSQFLGMIKIIEDHLKTLDVGFVTLTGASRKRGNIISKFNEDPSCQVYVGSLKAGGTGVDLVAGSVVIHYDRWWNAAKEDQATDRVHRIGQKRGVQVFKLVTQGTLEEKIAAIIEKKRNLMDAVIREDDPGLLKSFSREELIDILSIPLANGEGDDVDDIKEVE
jgi:SNF2 family DNA or RNA helicase